MKNIFLVLLLVSSIAFGVTANKVWRIPSGGTTGQWGPVNLADNTNAVTGVLPIANMPAANVVTSSASGTSYSNNTTTLSAITNQSVTITATGRPIMISTINDIADSASNVVGFLLRSTGAVTNNFIVEIALYQDGVAIQWQTFGGYISVSNGSVQAQMVPFLVTAPSAGSHTYALYARISPSSGGTSNITVEVKNIKTVATEIR